VIRSDPVSAEGNEGYGRSYLVKLYEQIDVWRRLDGGDLMCYGRFRVLSTGRYYCQSADFPVPSRLRYLEVNFLELLEEIAPDRRNPGYPTLLEAITAHDAEHGIPLCRRIRERHNP
jgi:hypothetical protein